VTETNHSSPSILVTGASGGIGAAICRVLGGRGASIVLHYQSDRAAAQKTMQALGGDGHLLLQADLGDPASVEKLWQAASRERRIEALVNNAGIFPDHAPLATDYQPWVAAWQRTLAVNLAGAAHLSYLAGRAMVEQGAGRIVSVSSVTCEGAGTQGRVRFRRRAGLGIDPSGGERCGGQGGAGRSAAWACRDAR
jgi:3-oxoacyl-[acyl-carrier protein] reductase